MASATKHEFVVATRNDERGQPLGQVAAPSQEAEGTKAAAQALLAKLQKKYQNELAKGREMAKDHLEALCKLQEELTDDDVEGSSDETAAPEPTMEGKGARPVRPSPYGRDQGARETPKA